MNTMSKEHAHIPVTPHSGTTMNGASDGLHSTSDQKEEFKVADAAHSATLNNYQNRNRHGRGCDDDAFVYFGAELVRNPDGTSFCRMDVH